MLFHWQQCFYCSKRNSYLYLIIDYNSIFSRLSDIFVSGFHASSFTVDRYMRKSDANRKLSNENRHKKTCFSHMRKQRCRSAQISFAVTAKLISAFVFATQIVQSLYFLNSKFQASSHLLCLYSLCRDLFGNPKDRFVATQLKMIINTGKPDFSVLDKVRPKEACAATETNQSLHFRKRHQRYDFV